MSEMEIFLAAIDIPHPTEREAFVTQACAADPELRGKVESLLAAHDRSGEFLDVPALEQIGGRLAPDRPAQPDETARATRVPPAASHSEIDLSFLEPSTTPDSIGRLGHYEVRQVIGRGACGIVLQAFDETLRRVVALKAMTPELAATSPARKRFLREARAAAAIRHDNVVSIHSVEEQPIPFLVMEHIDGQTLQQRLDGSGPLELVEVLRIGEQIARGLEAAHTTGLIHRDIKPANILLESRPVETAGEAPGVRVKISDFGLARAADDASLTQSGMIAGTPLYMSAEQARGDTIDARSDLFSLGSVLYVMCSGRPPFRASTTLAVLKRVAEDEPRPIQEIIPEVPAWLSAIIAKLHAKNPADRFATAHEVAGLLARCLAALQQNGQVESLPQIQALLGERTVAMPPAPAAVVPGSTQGAALGTLGAEATRPDSVGRSCNDEAHSLPHPSLPHPSLQHPGCPELHPGCGRRRRGWMAAAASLVVAIAGLSFTEASGVTNLRGTVVRLFSPEGTLIVEVDDPGVSVSIDGEEMVITGAGAKEIRLKPGQYKVLASRNGELVRQELVTVTKNGLQVVRVSKEAGPVGIGSEYTAAANPQAGTPLSPRALVIRPAAIPGVRGWSLETTWSQEMFHMAFSPAGDVVATAGKDGSVRLYSADGTKLIKMLLGHAAAVKAVAWSPDGKTLASSGADQAIRVWDVATGRLVRTLPGYKDDYRLALAWSPDGNTLASVARDQRRIDLWDMTKDKPPVTIRAEPNGSALAWSPDSKLLVNSVDIGQKAFLQFRDGKTGELLRTSENTKSGLVGAIAWSPDGTTLATAHWFSDPGLFLWDASTGKIIRSLKEEKTMHPIADVVWLDDVKTLVSVSRSGFQYWDAGTGELVKSLGSAFGPSGGATCSRGGKLFASWQALWTGGSAGFFSPNSTPTGDITLKPTKGLVYWPWEYAGSTLDWSPDGMSLASHTKAGQIYLWDVQNGSPSRTWPDQQSGPWLEKVAWSPDGKQVLACRWDQISRWNPVPPQGQLLSSFKLDNGLNNGVHSLSPDQSRIVVAGENERVFLYDLNTGKRLHVLEEKEPAYVRGGPAISWSPDGKWLGVALANGAVRLWDPAEGKLVRDLAKGHTKALRTMAWSHDGKLLATGGDDDFLLLWDPVTGVAVRSLLDGHQGAVRSLGWSHDDQILYSSGDDKTVRAWKVDTGKQLDVLDGQQNSATTLRLSPDGKSLAVLNAADARIQIWDLPTRRLLGRLLMLPDGHYLAVSPDGHYRGSPKVDQNLVYVVETEKGQETLTPSEFAEKYGWKNDPDKVRLLRKTPAGPAPLTADPERQAAEWVLSRGGSVTLRGRGPQQVVAAGGELPADAFSVEAVNLARSINDRATGPDITDDDLARFALLPRLSTLRLNGTNVGDTGLVHIQKFSGLTYLSLDGTAISNGGMERLNSLTGLTHLMLHNTTIGDEGLRPLRSLRKLEQLNLAGTRVTDASLEQLKGLTGLIGLNLADTTIGDEGLKHLPSLRNLDNLSLNDTRVTDAGLEQLKGLTRLTQLGLANTQVSGAGLAHLRDLTGLRFLDLQATRISDGGLAHLQPLTGLESLDLRRNREVTNAGLEHLKSVTSLKGLLLGATEVTDAGLKHLAACKNLTFVSLNGEKVSEAGVKDLAAARPDLHIVWDGGEIKPKQGAAADPDRRAAEWVIHFEGHRGFSVAARL